LTQVLQEPSVACDEVAVVEDDPEINELIGAYVEIAGFRPRQFSRGRDVVRELSHRVPSVIVLDVMLPDVDGFEICRQLRGDSRTARVPIVMLTALDQEEMRGRALACGATEFLNKPFDPDALIDVIRRHACQ
jgi:two-component system phosphate regulon response regulator PhoB